MSDRIATDCWHPIAHAARHHAHPATGRPVCHICHPPAYVLAQTNNQPSQEGKPI